MFDLVFVCLTLDSRIIDFSRKRNRSATTTRGGRLSPDRSSSLLPSTPPARSCERRGSGGWSRLPTELRRCVGRVTETVIVVDTCLDHCQVSPLPAVSQQTFRDEQMLKF